MPPTDLLTYASSEASALVQQLLERRSAASLRHLEALREAIDAAARELRAPHDCERDVSDFALKLAQAADADIGRVEKEAAARIAALEGQIQEHAGALERAAAGAAHAETEVERLRSELLAAQERADSFERDLTLTVDAHAEVEAALRAAEAECRQLTASRDAIEQELADATAAMERLLAELAEGRTTLEAVEAERTALRQQLAEARAALEEERRVRALSADEGDRAVRSLEAAHGQLSEHVKLLESTIEEMAGAERQLRDELAAREGALAQTRGEHDALVIDFEALTIGHGTLQAERDGYLARIAALESTVAERDGRLAELEATAGAASASGTPAPAGSGPDADADVLRAEVDRMVALFDASARAVTEMAAAGSSSELLEEAVKRLSLQFSRVAWFRLKGNRLEGELQVGFEDVGDFSKLVIPLSLDSLLTRAVNSGTVQSLTGPDVPIASGTPFGGTPTSAVSLPIALNGTTLGVLYADDSDMPESARGPAVHESSVGFARLLVGQVVVLLVRHTHELKTLAELRQYAGTLLQEARAMHQADLEAGRAPEQIRSRLKENIDCASQLYAYRAAMEGTAAAALLDEQIAEEMTGTSAFAQDLAAVVSHAGVGDISVTAEAS